jgi:hypothetical protein
MTKKPLLVLALCAGVALAAYAAPGTSTAAGKATVGEFAVKVAVALGYTPVDSKAASVALKGRGVNLPADMSATLTEGDAARIMADLGMAVTKPTKPGAPVSTAKAGFLAGMIETTALDGPTIESVELPQECLHSVDRGTCVNCCKNIVGQLPDEGQGTRDAGKECGRFCQDNVATPPSPEEPTP